MTLDYLVELVSNFTGLDITSKCRDTAHVNARAIYYKLACDRLSSQSLARIGRAVGRDHATVLHSNNNVFPNLSRYFPDLYKSWFELNSFLALRDNPSEEEMEIAKLSLINSDLIRTNDDLLLRIRQIENRSCHGDDNMDKIIKMIDKVPSDKLELLRERVEPIVHFLCK